MRRIDLLINVSRGNTENTDYTDTTGISDNQFIEWANKGQDRIHSKIQNLHPDILLKTETRTVTSGVEEYTLASDTFLTSRVRKVEFSRSGNTEDYYMLPKGSLSERLNGSAGSPDFYIRQSNSILIQPKPQSSGYLRITYQKAIPKLDKRRGKISTVTLSSTQLTALTLDTTEFLDDARLNDYLYLTIVDANGNVKMQGVSFSNVSSSTGVVTLDPFTFASGESAAVGDYVCSGAFASTHGQLPDVCEKYVLQYMDYCAFKKDSNTDSGEAAEELKAMEEEILESFAEPDDDIVRVPIITDTYNYSEDI